MTRCDFRPGRASVKAGRRRMIRRGSADAPSWWAYRPERSWPWMGRGTARPTGRVSAEVRRQRVRQGGPHEVSGGNATCTTMAVICIRPSPQTGQRERSIPVSRCSRTTTRSGRTAASSGGGRPSRARHRVRVPRRVRLASRPKWRMRMKPRGRRAGENGAGIRRPPAS